MLFSLKYSIIIMSLCVYKRWQYNYVAPKGRKELHMKNITKYVALLLATLLTFCYCTPAFAEQSATPVDSTEHIHNAKAWDWETMAKQGFFAPDEANRLIMYKILLTLEYHGVTESQFCHIGRNDENTGFELRFLASDGEKYALQVWAYYTEDGWVDFYMPAFLLYQFIEEHSELCCD